MCPMRDDGGERELHGARVSAGRAVLFLVLLVPLVLLAPCATVLAVPPDAAAPPALEPKLPAAKHALVDNLDRGWTRARFIGIETRASDDLVVLMFEIYGWPNLAPMRAYLVSRCRPLAEIEPRMMGGGVVFGEFASNPELEYLRSPAQRPCPPR
jgi:hypothetical protein